jgi:phosphoglycolate phosphatase
MIKNIIFDWSGVINDNVETVYKAVLDIFKQFNGPMISFEEFRKEWIHPYMSFYNKYLPDLTIEDEQQAYKKAILKYQNPHTIPGFPETLRKIKDKEIRMFVISSDFPETLFPEIKLFNLEGIFTEVIPFVSDKLQTVKELVNKYQLNREETLIIGDSNHEIESGKAAGIKTATVTWGFLPEDKLMSYHPDYCFHNIGELENTLLG